MKDPVMVGRRSLLAGSLLLPFGARVVSAAPPATPVTPALVEAALKEGKVTYYTAMDLSVAEPMAKAFEARFPRRRRTAVVLGQIRGSPSAHLRAASSASLR